MSGLKEIQLGSFNEQMDDAAKEKTIGENFKNLRTFMGKTGVNLLVSKSITSELAFSNTTEDNLLGFTAAFQTTGGMVEIYFSTTVRLSVNASGCVMRLYVDDALVDSLRIATPTANVQWPVTLRHIAALGSGVHKLRVTKYADAAGGPVYVGSQNQHTKLTITEVLL